MGYDPDEPGVLQAWDIAIDSEGSRDARVSRMVGEPQAVGQEGNQPSARHGDGPILPQRLQRHPEERPYGVEPSAASSSRPSRHTADLRRAQNTSGRGSPRDVSPLHALRLDYEAMTPAQNLQTAWVLLSHPPVVVSENSPVGPWLRDLALLVVETTQRQIEATAAPSVTGGGHGRSRQGS